jgi:Tol biopolymer transport system component
MGGDRFSYGGMDMASPKVNDPKQLAKSRWLIPGVGLLIIIVGGGYLSSLENRNAIANLIWGTPPPVFSGRIAFVSDTEEIRFFGDIYLMNANEMNLINLTNYDYDYEVDEESPTWSPDGKSIAFSTRSPEWNIFRPSPSEIYVMNADGTNPINLTNNDYEADAVSPAWSPDGKYIAFSKSIITVRFLEETSYYIPPSDLYVMNADGTNPINLTQSDKADELFPAWSPDGKYIAFSKRSNMSPNDRSPSDIYVMNADGTNPINLTQSDKADELSPAWSPDGKYIAFTKSSGERSSLRSDIFGVFVSPAEIYVMNADGTNPINLTQSDKADERGPAWSPDGKYIAFSKGSRGWFYYSRDIYVMNADGTNPIALTHDQVYAHDPVWVP